MRDRIGMGRFARRHNNFRDEWQQRDASALTHFDPVSCASNHLQKFHKLPFDKCGNMTLCVKVEGRNDEQSAPALVQKQIGDT